MRYVFFQVGRQLFSNITEAFDCAIRDSKAVRKVRTRDLPPRDLIANAFCGFVDGVLETGGEIVQRPLPRHPPRSPGLHPPDPKSLSHGLRHGYELEDD